MISTYTRYGSNSLFSKHNIVYNKIAKVLNTSKRSPTFLKVDNLEYIMLDTMQHILAQDQFKGYEGIMDSLLIHDFIQDKSQSEDFLKLFENFSDDKKANKDDNLNTLIKCVVHLFERFNIDLINQYNSDGNKVWAGLRPFISVLRGIYYDDSSNSTKDSIKVNPIVVSLVRGLLQKSFETQKYFDLTKIFVSLYHIQNRHKMIYLIKRLFSKCDYDKRQKFLRAIDSKGCKDGKISSHACYVMMCMMLQVFITDVCICLNTALNELEVEGVELQKELTSLSRYNVSLPNFPIVYSHNKVDQSS